MAKNIVQIDSGKFKTKPTKNISLISPPPSDYFLNILSPNILSVYIETKAPTPPYI